MNDLHLLKAFTKSTPIVIRVLRCIAWVGRRGGHTVYAQILRVKID